MSLNLTDLFLETQSFHQDKLRNESEILRIIKSIVNGKLCRKREKGKNSGMRLYYVSDVKMSSYNLR